MFEYVDQGNKKTIILSFVTFYSENNEKYFYVYIGAGEDDYISVPTVEYKRFVHEYKRYMNL